MWFKLSVSLPHAKITVFVYSLRNALEGTKIHFYTFKTNISAHPYLKLYAKYNQQDAA